MSIAEFELTEIKKIIFDCNDVLTTKKDINLIKLYNIFMFDENVNYKVIGCDIDEIEFYIYSLYDIDLNSSPFSFPNFFDIFISIKNESIVNKRKIFINSINKLLERVRVTKSLEEYLRIITFLMS